MKKCSLFFAVLFITMLLLAGSCLAQIPNEANPTRKHVLPSTSVKGERVAAQLTKEDVEAFLDGFVPPELEQQDIAGAVVCVVKDGKVLFAHRRMTGQASTKSLGKWKKTGRP